MNCFSWMDIPTTFEDVRNINIDEIDEIEVIKERQQQFLE